MRVSLVHYWCYKLRGGEKVLHRIKTILNADKTYFNFAPLFPTSNNPATLFDYKTSFLSKIPFVKHFYKALLPIHWLGLKYLKIDPCDILISSESGMAKNVNVPKGAVHVCYVHTPMRYVWSHVEEYGKRMGRLKRWLYLKIVAYLRKKDLEGVKGVDHFIANSVNVQKRIKKYWGRDSTVIYPPVKMIPILNVEKEDYFLVVSELNEYKRVYDAVTACMHLGLNLKVVGTGNQMKRLKSISGDNIEYLGWVEKWELEELYVRARAFLMPQDEDFGMAAVEAMSAGTPVIARASGGALETVIDGYNGILDYSLMNGIRRFLRDGVTAKPSEIRNSVLRFSEYRFDKEIKEYVEKITRP